MSSQPERHIQFKLNVRCERNAAYIRDTRQSLADLDDGGVAELAGEVQGRSTHACIEVKAAASQQHGGDLWLVADDHTLKDVPATVVEYFQDVVRARTPTQQSLTTNKQASRR